MTGFLVVGLIVVFGALGGFVNALLGGDVHLPKRDPEALVWRPGWVGNVVIGMAAALVFWGIYGPAAATIVVGASAVPTPALSLHVNEMIGAMLSGIAGSRLLMSEVERRVLAAEKEQLEVAKAKLTDSVEKLATPDMGEVGE